MRVTIAAVSCAIFLIEAPLLNANPAPPNWPAPVTHYLESLCDGSHNPINGKLIDNAGVLPAVVSSAAEKSLQKEKAENGYGYSMYKPFEPFDHKFDYLVWEIKAGKHNAEWYIADVSLTAEGGHGYFYQMFVLAVDPKTGEFWRIADGGVSASATPIDDKFWHTVEPPPKIRLVPWDIVDIGRTGKGKVILAAYDMDDQFWGYSAYGPDAGWKEVGQGCNVVGD